MIRSGACRLVCGLSYSRYSSRSKGGLFPVARSIQYQLLCPYQKASVHRFYHSRFSTSATSSKLQSMMATPMSDEDDRLKSELEKLEVADISDAILSVDSNLPNDRRYLGGYLSGLQPLECFPTPPGAPQPPTPSYPRRLVARAFPVHVEDKSVPSRMPAGQVWSDECPEGYLVVMSQPADHLCGTVGGIHVHRLQQKGCKGLVVGGHVRDRNELLGWPVWARATSIVAAYAQGRVTELGGTVFIGAREDQSVRVDMNDWLVCDYDEGAIVVVPASIAAEVVDKAKKRQAQDQAVMDWVRNGGSVAEGFKKFRV